MNYQIFRLLEREELEAVMSYVSQQRFVDGRMSAHGLASDVRHKTSGTIFRSLAAPPNSARRITS
jgi:hypothetical protein